MPTAKDSKKLEIVDISISEKKNIGVYDFILTQKSIVLTEGGYVRLTASLAS